MTEQSGQYTKLPPGWDCKFDQTTGNCYYINYFTKVMQLEDPRIRYKQLQNEKCSTESIPLQPLNGSPYHVYPSNNFPAIRAFQGPNPSLHNISTSPLLSAKSQLQMEMSPLSHLKTSAPQTPRTGNMSRRSTIQETSFSSQTETDTVVAKIQNMFPTASENHIRLLLKKYLKNIFPKADETLLLDILANSDNNVQSASEKLLAMGYVKRDVAAPPKLSNRTDGQPKKAYDEGSKIIPLRPKVLTNEEKTQLKIRLRERFNRVEERIILMALESVNHSEDRATQILQIVQEEEESRAKKEAENAQAVSIGQTSAELTQNSSKKSSPRDSPDEEPDVLQNSDFQSIIGRIATLGHNSDYAKGADDKLLIADYVTWNGANPDMPLGQRNISIGPDPTILSERQYTAAGHNPDLCKGPKAGLAKGSIYSRLPPTNIRCN